MRNRARVGVAPREVNDAAVNVVILESQAAVIRTPYIDRIGLDLPWYFKVLKNQKLTKKYVVPLIHYLGSKALEEAATGATWKTVWSAGQSVGLVHEIISCDQIMKNLVREYADCIAHLPAKKP